MVCLISNDLLHCALANLSNVKTLIKMVLFYMTHQRLNSSSFTSLNIKKCLNFADMTFWNICVKLNMRRGPQNEICSCGSGAGEAPPQHCTRKSVALPRAEITLPSIGRICRLICQKHDPAENVKHKSDSLPPPEALVKESHIIPDPLCFFPSFSLGPRKKSDTEMTATF